LDCGSRRSIEARVVPTGSSDTFAAVDLGSNSFHMVVARLVQDQVHIVDRLRERVALAAGLDEKKKLTDDAQERALACLARFGERLRGMRRGSVRAVGTSALRVARNSRTFLSRAGETLGHPIEIILGPEEARLIYLGVAHDLSDDVNRRLVVDIGGGSTECILGERFEALKTDSLHMGCVNYSQRFFDGGDIKERAMDRAGIAARQELQPMERHYRALGWEECVGSSGTILAVDQILRASAWSDQGITPRGLRKLRKALIEAGHVNKLELPGLQSERASVLAGGVAILAAVFESLAIEQMTTSQGALREGVLYDLLGRIRHEDLRDRTIRRFSERYHIDLVQSGRVQRTALAFLGQVAEEWNIPLEEGQKFLSWAARLHEIGLSLSYSGYHKHGGYIVASSDMPGFSREDQMMLAALIEGHRRKISMERFEALAPSTQKMAMRLCVILRLSVLLNRSRGQQTLPSLKMSAKKNGYALKFPGGWLDGNPLTRADLEEETSRLAPLEFAVEIA
jgi:exopolyphosphatase/guanosine-5'-triphosphate,3'-diphosphate pyrophosphatase